MADALCKFELEEILGTRPALQDPENLPDEQPADPVGTRLEKMRLDELNKNATEVSFDWNIPVSSGDPSIAFGKRQIARTTCDGYTKREYDSADRLIREIRYPLYSFINIAEEFDETGAIIRTYDVPEVFEAA
jgi:hypothetical protein